MKTVKDLMCGMVCGETGEVEDPTTYPKTPCHSSDIRVRTLRHDPPSEKLLRGIPQAERIAAALERGQARKEFVV